MVKKVLIENNTAAQLKEFLPTKKLLKLLPHHAITDGYVRALTPVYLSGSVNQSPHGSLLHYPAFPPLVIHKKIVDSDTTSDDRYPASTSQIV